MFFNENPMRRMRMFPVTCLALALGCGEPGPTPVEAPLSAEKQEAEASRVFGLAQQLEKDRKPQDAIASYRHITRNFPNTPHGKKATERLKKIQVRM